MKNSEFGRSMVEMLGVLAIIGVLSVTGITGYMTAMRRYRSNEIVQTVSMLAVMAQSANSGEGKCVELSTSDLSEKLGGINLKMKAEPSDINEKVDVEVGLSDDSLCEDIGTMLGNSISLTCGEYSEGISCEDND